jgi:hypothetical protein
MSCHIAQLVSCFFDFYADEQEFLAKLENYIGGEDAIWDLLKKLKLKHPSEVGSKVIEYVTTQAGWELLDIITGLQVELVPKGTLYVFERGNPYAEFLVNEGYLYSEELVVYRLALKEIEEGLRVPVFVAIDGTEYPAIVDLLYEPEEWGKLENPHFLHPLELKIDITPEEVEELLERPAELKKLLAQAL